MHYVRLMADLFPDKVIAFVNLPVYLTKAQYNELCELAVSLQLCVLSYEQGGSVGNGNLENMLYVDKDYLEVNHLAQMAVPSSREFARFEVLEQRHSG